MSIGRILPKREKEHIQKKCIKNIWKVRKLIEKGHLLRKMGFYKTLSILPSDGAIKLSEFYAKLTKTSYYNVFLRVKSDLLKKKIIEIGYEQKPVRHIGLTKNGVVLKHLLREIIEQIEKGDNK